MKRQKIVCSNCGEPFHGLTACKVKPVPNVPVTMPKTEALRVIVRDVIHFGRHNVASYRRVKRALAALGFTGEDEIELLKFLDYHDTTGAPYAWAIKTPPRAKKK